MNKKKGLSIWVSWVLLMTFVVFLSALMANWMRSYAESEVADVKSRIYDSQQCNGISFYIKDVFQNSENLNIELVNNNLNRIDSLMIRFYNESSSLVDPIQISASIKPNQAQSFLIKKSDYGFSGDVEIIQILPLVILKDSEIICRNRLVQYEI